MLTCTFNKMVTLLLVIFVCLIVQVLSQNNNTFGLPGINGFNWPPGQNQNNNPSQWGASQWQQGQYMSPNGMGQMNGYPYFWMNGFTNPYASFGYPGYPGRMGRYWQYFGYPGGYGQYFNGFVPQNWMGYSRNTNNFGGGQMGNWQGGSEMKPSLSSLFGLGATYT